MLKLHEKYNFIHKVWKLISFLYNIKKIIIVIKGFVKSTIPYCGMTSDIIYYDFESCEYRTAVCRGEAFDKYRVKAGELVDVLAIEKRNGIRLLGVKPDTIN